MSPPGFFVRHRIGLRWTVGTITAVLFLASLGLVGGSVYRAMSASRIEDRFDALPNVTVPGTATLQLPTGVQTVWVSEPDTAPASKDHSYYVVVRDPRTREPLDFKAISATERQTFTSSQASGNAIGAVTIPSAGAYIVEVSGPTGRTIVIGESDITDAQDTYLQSALFVAGAITLATLGIFSLILLALLLVLARKPRPAIGLPPMPPTPPPPAPTAASVPVDADIH